jgi:hypothetical protein
MVKSMRKNRKVLIKLTNRRELHQLFMDDMKKASARALETE